MTGSRNSSKLSLNASNSLKTGLPVLRLRKSEKCGKRSTEMSTFPCEIPSWNERKIHRFLSTRATRPEGRGPCLAPLPDSTSRQINPPPTTTRYGQCARDGASSSVLFAQPSATRPDLSQVLDAGKRSATNA